MLYYFQVYRQVSQFCIYIYPFILRFFLHVVWASQVLLVVKKLPANEGSVGLMPGFGRSPGGERGNPLQLFLPGESHGQRSLASYSPQGRKGLDTSKETQHAHIGRYRVLSRAPVLYSRSLLGIYYTDRHLYVSPTLPVCPSTLTPGNQRSVFYICDYSTLTVHTEGSCSVELPGAAVLCQSRKYIFVALIL